MDKFREIGKKEDVDATVPLLEISREELAPVLAAWRSNERNSFLAGLSIGPFEQFGFNSVFCVGRCMN